MINQLHLNKLERKINMKIDIEHLFEINKIVNIINSGLCKEKYEKWSKHPSPMVRYALVCNNFKPELFIYDDNPMVRSEALQRRPDLQKDSLRNIINNPEKLEFIEKILSKQTHIDIDVLKNFVSNCKKYNLNIYYEPYEIKLNGNQIKLSKDEQKISPYELFKINNPAWARDFNSEAIQSILEMSDYQNDIDDKEFERYFTPKIEPKGGKIILK